MQYDRALGEAANQILTYKHHAHLGFIPVDADERKRILTGKQAVVLAATIDRLYTSFAWSGRFASGRLRVVRI
ncbi:hypothetical protein BRY73_23125 [Ochrobactrum sp. P6BS-III]|nr:hypothetical protein [Ochrobactrum sp. P6BSIII]OOL14678.1 hypothetical protein BRY73_23125 [Ochrobactrum sp. P6BS-III]